MVFGLTMNHLFVSSAI